MQERKKILLVEDDFFVSDIYRTKLKNEEYDVTVAENGLVSLEELEKGIPDLVLLDIVMPYMDGMEVLKKMKGDERWKKIPVILLTNLSEKEEVRNALELGADDYLIKSHFTPSEVLSKVQAILAK